MKTAEGRPEQCRQQEDDRGSDHHNEATTERRSTQPRTVRLLPREEALSEDSGTTTEGVKKVRRRPRDYGGKRTVEGRPRRYSKEKSKTGLAYTVKGGPTPSSNQAVKIVVIEWTTEDEDRV